MVPPMASWVNSGPPAVRSPPSSPQAPSADPDIPLNLTKPKHSPAHQVTESPLAASKLLPSALVMPRAFLHHYVGLPPHVNPTGTLQPIHSLYLLLFTSI